MDDTKPIITFVNGTVIPDKAPKLTTLDIARINAAYGCPDVTHGPCQRHYRLTDNRPELTLSSSSRKLRNCTVLISVKPGKRVFLETRRWKVEPN